MSNRWTKEEENLLRDGYLLHENIDTLCTLFPHRTKSSITTKLYKLGISRSRSWSQQEINKLISLRNTGVPVSVITKELSNRTQGSIEKKIQELISNGLIDRIRPIQEEVSWLSSEVDFLLEEYSTSSVKELAQILNRTENSIRGKIERLRSSGILLVRKKEEYARDTWSKTDIDTLIKLNKEETPYYEIAKKLNRTIGSIYAKANSLKKQGIPIIDMRHTIRRGMDSSRDTTVYLVHFLEEDFYKIGITQQSIRERFYGYPEYEIIDSIICGDLIEAMSIEHRILVATNSGKYTPISIKDGKTECFKLPERLSVVSIETLLN